MLLFVLLTGCASFHSAPVDNLNTLPLPLAPSTADLPKSMVLLLPLTGDFAHSGQMVQAGFLAADQKSITDHQIKLTVLNTQDYSTPIAAYKVASATEPTLIVGPLTKPAVNELTNEVHIPIPTLALNQSDPNTVSPMNLFQFSLNPQEDAIDTAEKINQAGIHRVIVLAEESDWGQGIATSFSQAWIAQDGEIVDSLAYDTNNLMTEEIKNFAQGLNKQDLSNTAAFIVASAKKANKIIPMLKTACPTLPLYALPISYDGHNSANLESVQFEISPWLLDPQNPISTTVQQKDPNASTEDMALYAFGADAYALSQFYLTHHSFAGLAVTGYSGYLTMNTNGVVARQEIWVQIIHGKLTPVPTKENLS